MKTLPTLAVCALVFASPLHAESKIGINLAGLADWNTEIPFADQAKMSRRWLSQAEGQPWGKGPEIELDAHGNPLSIPAGATVIEKVMMGNGNTGGPFGDFHLLFEGSAKWASPSQGDGALVEVDSGHWTLRNSPQRRAIHLTITEIDNTNPPRNIRFIHPGLLEHAETNPFHPVFLNRWQGMACLRFMDWMSTNNSTIVTWEDRPKPDDSTWTTKGAPVEVMVDLANRLKSDPWFCMPHRADDGYIRSFAEAVKAALDPSLKVYIEYSNEVWNGQFDQTKYAQAKAKELGLGDPSRPWEGGCLYYAQRSLEIFKIWEEVFGGPERLVRVLAWQAGSGRDWTGDRLLSAPGVKGNVDALAIAPYISFNVPGKADGSGLDAATVAMWTEDQTLDYLENTALPKAIDAIQRHKAVADEHGVKLICYEAGQHVVGTRGGENNQVLENLFKSVNRSPRMGHIYKLYMDAWKAAGGDVMALFSSIGTWSKWGSWGLAETASEKPTDSPKYQAVLEWAAAQGQKVNFDPGAGYVWDQRPEVE